MATTFAICQVDTREAESALDRFITRDIHDARGQITEPSLPVYLYCCLDNSHHTGRRILVVSEIYENVIRVCIEAAYELFEGDTHYHVERVGKTPREIAAAELPELVRQAYRMLVEWKPTHENIWDNVY